MGKTLAVSLLVFAVVGFALATAGTDDVDDIDIIMSDVPLTGFHKLEGEHQANDFGPVILIVVEMCNGTPI